MTGSGSLVCPCAEGKLRSSASAKAVSVDAVAYGMRPGVVLNWEAFNTVVAGFDAEQAGVRRFAATAVLADMEQLAPTERQFDLLAISCSTLSRTCPLVRFPATPALAGGVLDTAASWATPKACA